MRIYTVLPYKGLRFRNKKKIHFNNLNNVVLISLR